MEALVIRCQNGVVVWVRESVTRGQFRWRCTRDNFVIQAPSDSTQLEQALVSLASHSTGLAGAIVEVVELVL